MKKVLKNKTIKKKYYIIYLKVIHKYIFIYNGV